MTKGIIFDIKRFALHDGPGIRTTVFMKGCPMQCRWCHNPEGIDSKISSFVNKRKLHGEIFYREEAIGREVTTSELLTEIEKDRPFFEESGGGVTFSGGEPLMQHNFLVEMLDLCKSLSIHSCVDTSGYASDEVIRDVASRANLLLFDLKHPDADIHKKITGVELSVVTRNLAIAAMLCKKIWIRIPVIPDNNHLVSLADGYREIIEVAADSIEQVNLLPFHATADHKYRRLDRDNPMINTPSLNSSDLDPMANSLRLRGLNVVIGG